MHFIKIFPELIKAYYKLRKKGIKHKLVVFSKRSKEIGE